MISLEILLTAVFALVIGGIIFLSLHLSKMRDFWPSRGFFFLDSTQAGGMIRNLLKGVQVIDIDVKLYNLMKTRKEPCAGYLEFSNPALFIQDLDLVKNIFIKDFDHFVDRRNFNVKNLDPLANKMIFFMDAEPWKELRTKISPTFTTGKIRRMFDIVNECGERLVQYMKEELKTKNVLNMADGLGKYQVDVIATSAFGIESGAFGETKSMFETNAEKLQFDLSLRVAMKFIMIFLAPRLAELAGISLFDPSASNFFRSVITNAIKQRTESGQKRNDFLQLMLEIQSGQLKTETENLEEFEKEALLLNLEGEEAGKKIEITNEVICAQSMLFFLAGFDTTQNLLKFATYQLATCPDAQENLFQEVQESLRQNKGKFTYESINEMEYMDKFVSETLRMYPPVPRLERRCTKEYKIPNTELVIPVGTLVAVPSYAIHHDESIFGPDPYKFDPERFSKSKKAERSPHTYMPFGHGPRNCIGMRFALTESKLALAHLVQAFQFEPCDKTPIPMKFALSPSLKPENGMWVKLTPRMEGEE